MEFSKAIPFLAIGESLEIRGNAVYWINNGSLVRKFTFSEGTCISSAIFTSFKASTQGKSLTSKSLTTDDSPTENAIVIIIMQCAHVYYLSGASYLVNLPYSISKVLSCHWGLVLSRDVSSDAHAHENVPAPNFFLMSDPLLDLGAIVSSSIASISQSEEMIYFGDSMHFGEFCVTFDIEKDTLKVYSVRHISSHNSSFTHQLSTRIKDHSRRKSSRVSSGYFDATDSNLTLETSLFPSKPDQNTSNAREVASLDMAENFSGFPYSTSSSTSTGTQNIHKEALLTLIDSFRLKSNITDLDAHLFSFSTGFCVVVTDSAQHQAIFLSFEWDPSQKIMKFKGSQKMEAISVSPTHVNYNGIAREVAVILTSEPCVNFYDPFSNILSDNIRFPSDKRKITKLSNYKGNIYAITEEGHYKTELTLEPHSSLVIRCFKLLGLILDESDYIAFSFLWASIMIIEGSFTEWDALVSSVILLFVPSECLKELTHSLTTHPDIFAFSEQYCVYLSIAPKFLTRYESVNYPNFRQQFLFSLFLIKEDSRLDIALRSEVTLVEELLLHLSSWSACLASWGNSIALGKTKKIPCEFHLSNLYLTVKIMKLIFC